MEWLTTAEAAQVLGLKQTSIRVYIFKQKLAGTKRGRDWMISREEVERYRREKRPRKSA